MTIFLSTGRKLPLRRESPKRKGHEIVTTSWYRCEDCSDCPCRNDYRQAKDSDKPKEVRLQKILWEKRAVSQSNITTEYGIYVRMCRSSQAEGTLAFSKTTSVSVDFSQRKR